MQYFTKLNKRTVIAVVLLGFVALSVMMVHHQSSMAQEDSSKVATDPIVRISAEKSSMKVVKLFSKVVQLDRRIKRVDGFDPDVLTVTPLGTKAIRVHAVAPGLTSLTLIDEANKVYSVEVLVTGDVRHLQAYIAELFPKDSVQAVEVGGAVVLRGWVTQPEHITELTELAEQFYERVINQMRVGGEQRVVLRVKIMEAQRSKIRKMGFNFQYVNRNAILASAPGTLAPLGILAASIPGVAPAASTSPATLANSTISFGLVNRNNAFNGFLEALKEESLLKILAEPNLVATNGRAANMLSGGEFPILVPSGLGIATIEFRPFGVQLEAVPIILGNNRVRLELHPTVSERDFSTSVTTGNIVVPGLKTREVNTMVEMKFGETLMIAGLIQKQQIATTSKVPILGDMPWIGAAFSRKSFQDSETELVIMVTPELVAPIPVNQVPDGGPGQFTDTPTGKEFYIDNMIEIPNYNGQWAAPSTQQCRLPNVDRIAPTRVPSLLDPQSPGITPFQPGRNGDFNVVPHQKEQNIAPQLPPPPTKTKNKTKNDKTAYRSSTKIGNRRVYDIPPSPANASPSYRGVKQNQKLTQSSRSQFRDKKKYELPIWARDTKPDPFAGPDPARQVGFTSRSKAKQGSNQAPRNQSRYVSPYRNSRLKNRSPQLTDPNNNLFLPR